MFSDDPPKVPFKAPTDIASWFVIAAIIGLGFGLSYVFAEGRAWAVALSAGVITLLIQFSWPLRTERWFWTILAAFGAAHFWASVHFDWSWVSERGGLKLLGLVFAVDYLAMVGITYAVYRMKYGTPCQSIEPSIDDLPRYDARDLDL